LLGAGDRLVKLEGVTSKGLIAKGVEAEGSPALVQHDSGVVCNRVGLLRLCDGVGAQRKDGNSNDCQEYKCYETRVTGTHLETSFFQVEEY
jgi:hypothetical protein